MDSGTQRALRKEERRIVRFLNLTVCIVALLTSGMSCRNNSANRNIFNVELAAATTADAFMTGYGVYWKKATNDPAAFSTDMGYLIQQRNQLSQLSAKVGATIETVENLRAAGAVTNTALTNIFSTAIKSMDNVTTALVTSITNQLSQ